MQAPLCFDAATEGATGGLLVLPHPSMQQSEGRVVEVGSGKQRGQ